MGNFLDTLGSFASMIVLVLTSLVSAKAFESLANKTSYQDYVDLEELIVEEIDIFEKGKDNNFPVQDWGDNS